MYRDSGSLSEGYRKKGSEKKQNKRNEKEDRERERGEEREGRGGGGRGERVAGGGGREREREKAEAMVRRMFRADLQLEKKRLNLTCWKNPQAN